MRRTGWIITILCLALAAAAFAETKAGTEEKTSLPVKEVTVFKDGHALVLHEGDMPVEADGSVILDDLPSPILGAFWPYSGQEGVKLDGVVTGEMEVDASRTATTIAQFLQTNAGASVTVTDTDGKSFTGTILSVPSASVQPDVRPTASFVAPPDGVFLLKTSSEVLAMPIGRVRDVAFKSDPATEYAEKESRMQMRYRLSWPGGKPGDKARVGHMYVQKGIRWIPNYQIDLDGEGHAVIRLQATIINAMTDLENTTVRLVIGVPRFAFAEKLDPIGLQKVVAELAEHFSPQTAFAFSNAIVTQAVDYGRARAESGEQPADLGPSFDSSGADEDLFVFTVEGVTLGKGQRMVIPVAEYQVAYENGYRVELGMVPPKDVRVEGNPDELARIAQALGTQSVMHIVRLTNATDQPFTTAPALIFNKGRILCQSLMTYTPPNGRVDLDIATAVKVRVRKEDYEVSRQPNAERWEGDDYQRVNMKGTITLDNFMAQPVRVEVVRYVLGFLDEAGAGGEAQMLNAFELDHKKVGLGGMPWSYLPLLPYWWHHFHGVGRAAWTVEVAPGKSVELPYTWHYFWR